ncbi:MAG: hypothetical protein AMXMBFR25_03840 [Lysobacterales bacterium]
MSITPSLALADNVPQALPFAQNWTSTGLITTDNVWTGVPGIEGFRGDNITPGTGANPQTLLASDTPGVINVEANETNPNTFTTGGVAEFEIANPAVALNGSGTADAPYIKLYLNTTGCTGINVAYNVRDLDSSTDNAVQPVALHFRVGNSGNFTDVPAAFVADGTTGPGLATLVTPVSATLPPAADNQAEVQVRVMTANAVGNDEWVGIDDISVTGTCGGGPILSIDDVSVTEGNAGTVNAVFTVSLSAPAPAGGVGFDIATADNSATVANNDYAGNALAGQTIPMGATTYAFTVAVNGDTTPEPNETFFVNVSNVSANATLGDGQGVGTIVNDDITNINLIQGPGTASPLVGGVVLTRGVVYARRSNGFFIQNAPADVDANPLSSEGLFVFTGAAPPADAAVGNLVRVSGTVVEFVPASDPQQPPLTELGGAIAVTLESAGNPLPVPTVLTTSLPSPAGAFDQLERLEGMRVNVPAFTVNSGSNGNVNEPNATGSNNGVFHGFVAGAVPRSLREPGIQPPDVPPAGTIPPIPRWDGNPELIRVDSDALPGTTALVVGFGQTVNNLTGPLDYGFRRYTIYPEPAPTAPPTVSGSIVSGVVTAPTASEVTIASYNLQRFFDTVNDPGISEPVLTATAFANRLNKASLGIRNSLRTPDIVGVVEVENLSTLQALASRINTDAVAAAQPDPMYVAYLVEGNDPGGIDVGFLVKTAPAFGATARVTVTEVVQELDGSLFTNPDLSTATLNDRPPLRLTGAVTRSTGQTYPLTVIVNHLRSFNDATDPTPGSNGWPTEGHRVRAKRQAQAVDLANFVQTRQTGNPAEQIVLVGDFNAFEFNDGLGDSMGTIAGTPSPDNTTAVPGDGIDLVNPNLDNLFDSVVNPASRYSYNFDGAAQSLDHALVSASVLSGTTAPRMEHAHINADFPEIERSNAASPNRLSDHDPLLVYLTPNGFVPIEVSVAKTVSNPTPVAGGANFSYSVTVTNAGPQPAANVALNDVLPAGVVFQSLAPIAGWGCTTPAAGANGTVSCNTASMPVGSVVFQIVVSVPASVLPGAISNTATVTTSSVDINPANNSASVGITVQTQADLAMTLTDSPDPVTAGQQLSYIATLGNAGPSDAQGATITLPLPAGTSFVSATPSAGGSCNASSPVTCTWAGATAPGAARSVTVVALVAPAVLEGTVLTATATASSTTTDPNPANNSASTTTTVIARADLQIGLASSHTQVLINVPVTFTATSLNAGPSDAQNLSITLTLTPDFRYSSHVATGATCTTPQIGNTGAIVCTWAGATAPGVTRTLTVVAFSNVEGNTAVNASTTSSTIDPNPDNNAAAIAVVVGYPFNEIPTLSQWGLLLLGLLMAGVGFATLRRQD